VRNSGKLYHTVTIRGLPVYSLSYPADTRGYIVHIPLHPLTHFPVTYIYCTFPISAIKPRLHRTWFISTLSYLYLHVHLSYSIHSSIAYLYFSYICTFTFISYLPSYSHIYQLSYSVGSHVVSQLFTLYSTCLYIFVYLTHEFTSTLHLMLNFVV
jgi:hypothetical protein